MVAALAAASVAIAAGAQLSHASSFNPDPVFPVGPISGTTSHQIAKLDQVASALAGRHAIVNCWSQSGWTQFQAWQSAHHYYWAVDANGVTYYTTRRIQLSPFVCQVLSQALARTADQPLFTAWAVTVLAHESAHASGIKVESQAECRGIETEPRAAQLLGIAKPLAIRLQRIYRGTIYPYDAPRYRTPVCAAGEPGTVVSDTLGSAAQLAPLGRTATAVGRTLPGWKNIGGADSVGPLSPCSPAVNRTHELARLGEALLGPHGASLVFAAVRFQTKSEFHTALVRYDALQRCDIVLERRLDREDRTGGTITYGRMPKSVSNLAPTLHAFRDVFAERGDRWNRDSFFIFSPSRQTMTELFFRVPVGTFPFSVELRATKAALQTTGR